MKRCTVSVIDGDGEPHQAAVNATSVFDAVYQAIEQWSRLWWFDAGAVAECASHELLEALADPMMGTAAFVDGSGFPRFYLRQTCDLAETRSMGTR